MGRSKRARTDEHSPSPPPESSAQDKNRYKAQPTTLIQSDPKCKVTFCDELHKNRFKMFKQRKICAPNVYDEGTMKAVYFKPSFDHFIRILGWEVFINVDDSIVDQPILEFLSSLKVEDDGTLGARFSYRVANKEKTCTVQDLCRALGLPLDGMYYEECTKFDEQEAMKRLTCWRRALHRSRIHDTNFHCPKNSKARDFCNLAVRILHRIVTSSVFGRDDVRPNVRKDDLFVIFNAVQAHRVNTGSCVIHCLREISSKNPLTTIGMGHIICHFLKQQGFEAYLKRWTPRYFPDPIDGIQLQEMGILAKHRSRTIYLHGYDMHKTSIHLDHERAERWLDITNEHNWLCGQHHGVQRKVGGPDAPNAVDEEEVEEENDEDRGEKEEGHAQEGEASGSRFREVSLEHLSTQLEQLSANFQERRTLLQSQHNLHESQQDLLLAQQSQLQRHEEYFRKQNQYWRDWGFYHYSVANHPPASADYINPHYPNSFPYSPYPPPGGSDQ